MNQYVSEVRTAHFPEPDHVYAIEPTVLAVLKHYLDQESLTDVGEGLGLGVAA